MPPSSASNPPPDFALVEDMMEFYSQTQVSSHVAQEVMVAESVPEGMDMVLTFVGATGGLQV